MVVSYRNDDNWTIAHDFTFEYGGAEWVTHCLAATLPTARVHVLAGEQGIADRIAKGRTFVKWPNIGRPRSRIMSPIWPLLLEASRPIRGNLLVSSYAFAHHLRATGRVLVYCHTPLRQIWSGRETYLNSYGNAYSYGLRLFGSPLRHLDRRAANRADVYVATSEAVRRRIATYYGRADVPIVPPPFDHRFFYCDSNSDREEHYLWAGRIVEPYKRLSLVVDCFRQMPTRHLLVVGDGPDRARIARRAPGNVKFVGALDPSALGAEYRRARAVIFPSTDDFGLVPVEASACGTPVIAFAHGGALDTVIDGLNGVFFREATVESLAAAILRFEGREWTVKDVAGAAAPFSRRRFEERLRAYT